MKRLMEYTVFAGLGTAGRFARGPTSRSPVLVKATTDGTVRPPSAEAMTVGSPPSITATTEFVVPRSMPIILPIGSLLLVVDRCWLVSCLSSCRRPVPTRRARRRPKQPLREPAEGRDRAIYSPAG